MSSVSPETSSVCFSSRRYSGIISEGDSIRSPFFSSRSKVGFTVAMAYLTAFPAAHPPLVSVTIVDDRRCACNRAVEAFGSPAKLPVIRQERFLCGAADPSPGKQRVRQIGVAEWEAAELVGEQEAPP